MKYVAIGAFCFAIVISIAIVGVWREKGIDFGKDWLALTIFSLGVVCTFVMSLEYFTRP